MTNGSFIKVERIAECSKGSILQYFRPSLSDNWAWKPIFSLLKVIVFHRFYCTCLKYFVQVCLIYWYPVWWWWIYLLTTDVTAVNGGSTVRQGTKTVTSIATLKWNSKICSHWQFNSFKPNGISHCYQLDQSISVLRVVGWYFSFLLCLRNNWLFFLFGLRCFVWYIGKQCRARSQFACRMIY